MNECHTSPAKKKVCVVLPVTLEEADVALGPANSWRSTAIDEGALRRISLLLRSFTTQFDHEGLANFFIVSPTRDVKRLSIIVRSITTDSRYEIVSEVDVCRNLDRAINARPRLIDGWQLQQIIKLAMSEYVSTNYYLTLDSDIVCVHSSSYDRLIKNDQAVTNCETPTDYLRMYTDAFALKERQIKTHRYNQSGRLLGCSCLHGNRGWFHGETPVVLRTEVVRDLRAYLTKRFQRDWTEVLAHERGWTEYSMYYHYLDMVGKMNAHCLYRGCNTVLDLERSVWQASGNYREVRSYNADHFARSEGLFVAIQSWLPVSSWLPKRFKSTAAFYEELEIWCNLL